MAVELTADQARRLALCSQGLLTSAGSRGPIPDAEDQVQAVLDMLHRLGAVQLDTISVLARSHELVAYARLGALHRQAVEAAYWSGGDAFEYWSHAACILPMHTWPLFAFRRREFVRRGVRWHEVSEDAITQVRQRLVTDGPLTTKDIGGAKRGGPWWDWSQAKVAVEFLLDTGEVACTQRQGWRRVYDLAERVVPDDLRVDGSFAEVDGVMGPSDEECQQALIRHAASTLGVGTTADIADVHRLKGSDVQQHAQAAGLIPVQVLGWGQRAWATRQALDWLGSAAKVHHRTTMLSPFDSLIWFRARAERIFGMSHRLEAYTPATKRVHGYFAMPVLHEGNLVARVDPKRETAGRHVTLLADRVTLEVDGRGAVPSAAVEGTAIALAEAATWIGAGEIRIDTVVPTSATTALRRAVASHR